MSLRFVQRIAMTKVGKGFDLKSGTCRRVWIQLCAVLMTSSVWLWYGRHSIGSCANKRLTTLTNLDVNVEAPCLIPRTQNIPGFGLISTIKCQSGVSLSTVTTTGARRKLDVSVL